MKSKFSKDGRIFSVKPYSIVPEQTTFRLHTHKKYEILHFFEGDADFYVEDKCYRLRCGDIVLTRPDEAHYLQLRSKASYDRLYINFDPVILDKFEIKDKLMSIFDDRPPGINNIYSSLNVPNNNWKYYTYQIHILQTEEEKICYLLPLLHELVENKEKAIVQPIQNSNKIAAVSEYINSHFTEALTVKLICERFYISESQLNTIATKAFGTTIWKYIRSMRLNHAHELLCEGYPPKKAFELSGYTDYPSFYKAYKNKYGKSPKEAHIKRRKMK